MTFTPGISAGNGSHAIYSTRVTGVSQPLDVNPNQSAVSWAAIFSGTTAAAAVSLILLVPGAV
jgi:hypothetical protein